VDAPSHGDVTVAASDPSPLFVLGGHRGGSTLLQRVLNSYDDVAVWGEHEGVLTPIAQAYFGGAESPHIFRNVRPGGPSDPREDWQAWMSAVGPADWDAAYRRLVTSLFLPADAAGIRHWGFKEIRYGTRPSDRAIELLARLFPEARVAFIVRNPFNMLASARSRPERPHGVAAVAELCARTEQRFRTYLDWHRSGRVRSYWIVYEEFATGAGEIHRLLADLGHSLGPAQRAVIDAQGEGRGTSFRDADVNERWRRLPGSWLAVARRIMGPLGTELGYPLPPVSPFWRATAPWLARGRRDV